MAVPLTSTSCEGSQWTKEGGLGTGLPSFGVIKPETNLKPKTRSEDVYSIAIIGAGYAGLTAARDLTSIGQQVLLLEARDRIGGRTWSSDIGGYPFELGGTVSLLCSYLLYLSLVSFDSMLLDNTFTRIILITNSRLDSGFIGSNLTFGLSWHAIS